MPHDFEKSNHSSITLLSLRELASAVPVSFGSFMMNEPMTSMAPAIAMHHIRLRMIRRRIPMYYVSQIGPSPNGIIGVVSEFTAIQKNFPSTLQSENESEGEGEGEH